VRTNETADCPVFRLPQAGTQDETRYVSQLKAERMLYENACVCREIFTCIDAMMESPCREAIG